MSIRICVSAASIIFAAAIAGCGGGGGGGGVAQDTSASVVPFSSHAATGPNQTVVMQGSSATLSGTSSASGTAASVTGPEFNSGTLRLGYDEARTLSSVSITTPQTSFSVDRKTAGHSLGCDGMGSCLASNSATGAVVADPSVFGWNYQTYGVWGMDTGPGSWNFGVISAGNATSGSALPTTGNAVFKGIAGGYYIDPAGAAHGTAASMRADVNFGSRSIQFSTSNTTLNGEMTDNGLNLSGTLSYGAGVNAFSGTVQTQNSLMNGQAAGRFYGPAAQEIGGTYSVRGSGVSSMVGGFGGKKE